MVRKPLKTVLSLSWKISFRPDAARPYVSARHLAAALATLLTLVGNQLASNTVLRNSMDVLPRSCMGFLGCRVYG